MPRNTSNARPRTDSPARTDNPATEVLGEGISITGEVRVKLFGMNLLPVEVKLMISSTELAEVLGLAWWPRRGRVGGRERGDARGSEASMTNTTDDAPPAPTPARTRPNRNSSGASRRRRPRARRQP